MEKEEQIRVHEEWEEEVEEAALLVRKSKPSNDSTTINGAAKADNAATNGVSSHGDVESNGENGYANGSIASETENGATNGSSNVEEEHTQGLVDPTTTTTLPDDEVDKTLKANGEQEKSENSICYDKDEGENLTSLFPGEESANTNPAPEKQNGTSEGISVEKSPSTEVIHNDHSASYKSSSIKEIESEDVDLIEETDPDVAGVDLEKVLQKQNTHDLYCPNCNSCITRRVILRKRKRGSRNLGEDGKRNKPETTIENKVAVSSLQSSSDRGLDTLNVHDDSSSITIANEHAREREPDLFRCLSCFSFFIPSGDGFKLFRTFGRKGERPTTQDEQIPETNRSWFSSIFASNKVKKPAEQESVKMADNVRNEPEALAPSVNLSNENDRASSINETVASIHISEGLVHSGTTKTLVSAVNDNSTTNLGDKPRMLSDQGGAAMDDFEVETVAAGTTHVVTDGERAADAVSATRQDGLKLLISSDVGPPILDKFQGDQRFDILKKNHDDEVTRNNSVSNGKAYISLEIPQDYEQHTESKHVTKTEVEDITSMYKVSNEDGFYTNQVSKHTTTTTETNFQTGNFLIGDSEVAANIASGGDTIILVETGPVETEASVRAPLLGAQVNVVERGGAEAGERYGIEIIKSIVYGGLVESITSLSVVSSAAGGGASTLNTVALGLANLLGGIFFIIHNLWHLKNAQEDQAINQVTEKADQYRELLGRRKNFILHAVVAMLSYLIFGLLPPIIYGFSFRKSDDRELKLVIVAAASFLCILILAIAKGYVQRPPKSYIRTVFRYIILGIMVSGVSYVAGELFNRLLENLGLFESSSVPALSFPEMAPNKQAWASF